MPVVDLIPPVQVWACRDCNLRIETRGHGTKTPLHECAGHGGFRLPMMAEGLDARLKIVEREDYVGSEDAQLADGRPVMRAEIEHADGHTDAWVYAPTAHAGSRA
jgi:hypothetical protein